MLGNCGVSGFCGISVLPNPSEKSLVKDVGGGKKHCNTRKSRKFHLSPSHVNSLLWIGWKLQTNQSFRRSSAGQWGRQPSPWKTFRIGPPAGELKQSTERSGRNGCFYWRKPHGICTESG